MPSWFCFWELTSNFPECSTPFSLNFGVPTELEASELPKGLVLGRDGNIHLRIAPLGDNFPMDCPSWDCSRMNSLNFGVPMELEANKLPKCLVLGRNGNIHIRLRGSTPLGNVQCYNPHPLGARCPRWHTSS
ncbi:hypothetical protein DVH24_016844 [Malus domestica]|uniref:Uncharacterized protein n=1 Tax=Malus domestica TaxID=3750 RepID=A0A498HVJ6_MALDO|nr:hypothetical protein DVH24_016844 [Malus domestica]